MDLNKLKIFKCVADMGGISIAASELKMRQSSISTAISSLETELGYKILQRHYRGMALTKMGKKFYEFSKKTLLEYESFLASTEEDVGEVKIEGMLTIATSFGLSASDWFIKKLCTIMEKYPELKIKVINYREGDANISLADILICPFISGRSDLLQNEMEDFSFRLFASKEYIEKFGLPQRYEDLDNHKLVSFSKILRNPFDEVDSLLHKGCDSKKLRNVCLEINNSIGLLKIIKEGYGIAALPVEEGLEEGLIPLFGSNDMVNKTTCFTYSKDNKSNVIIKAVESIFVN